MACCCVGRHFGLALVTKPWTSNWFGESTEHQAMPCGYVQYSFFMGLFVQLNVFELVLKPVKRIWFLYKFGILVKNCTSLTAAGYDCFTSQWPDTSLVRPCFWGDKLEFIPWEIYVKDGCDDLFSTSNGGITTCWTEHTSIYWRNMPWFWHSLHCRGVCNFFNLLVKTKRWFWQFGEGGMWWTGDGDWMGEVGVRRRLTVFNADKRVNA